MDSFLNEFFSWKTQYAPIAYCPDRSVQFANFGSILPVETPLPDLNLELNSFSEKLAKEIIDEIRPEFFPEKDARSKHSIHQEARRMTANVTYTGIPNLNRPPIYRLPRKRPQTKYFRK